MIGTIMRNRPKQHVQTEGRVVPGSISGETSKCAAIISRAGAEGVENLTQPVRTIVVQSGQTPFAHYRPRSETKNRDREDEQCEHRHLHVVCFNFLPRYSRGATNHQASDENREHYKHKNPVEARPDSTNNDLSYCMLNNGTKPPSAVNESCIELTAPQDASVVTVAKSAGVENAEPDLLALHVSVRYGDAQMLMDGIA